MTLKHFLLVSITAVSWIATLGQRTDTWTAFWNEDSTLIGYKDTNGIVKIEPIFSGFFFAEKFDNVIAISEGNNGELGSYYLTKTGRTFGEDSLFNFDFRYDCESEGFIRFRDPKTAKIGMFDQTGKIAIPAIYDGLSRVRNGMVRGLKGAEKKYWDNHEHADCNHFSWSGGQEVLMDTSNTILIEDFKSDAPLNFFSLERTQNPHPDTSRESFLGIDGNFYSFVDFEKEFEQWITQELKNNITPERLISFSLDTITWESTDGWAKTNSVKLITDNFKIIQNRLQEILQPQTDYFISTSELNNYMYGGSAFEKYFDNCGESKYWIYPVLTLVISHKSKKEFTQNHYEFLRTDNGYKLIGLVIRNEKMN